MNVDSEMICELAARTHRIVTIEDHNRMGGFGSAVIELLADNDLRDVQVRRIALPDQFLGQGPAESLRSAHGLSVSGIIDAACELTDFTVNVHVDAGRLMVRT